MGEAEQEQQEQELFQLSDLQVDRIGLVRRGANRTPFYFVKSESGEQESEEPETDGGAFMAEANDERYSELLARLDKLEGMSQENVDTLKGLVQERQQRETFSLAPEARGGVVQFIKAQGGNLPAPALEMLQGLVGEEALTEATQAEEFAAALAQQRAQMEEQFAAKLKEEREAREAVAEQFVAERQRRRLAEFGQTVQENFAALSTPEEFAADLMTVADLDEELYTRLTTVLKAANEAVEKGGLFEQYSRAGGATEGEGSAFEQKVEAVRLERFATEGRDAGWVKAFDVVNLEYPELARQYAKEGLDG